MKLTPERIEKIEVAAEKINAACATDKAQEATLYPMEYWRRFASLARTAIPEILAERREREALMDRLEIAVKTYVEEHQLTLVRAEQAESELEAIREREGACCPEDVGFDEYITALKAENAARVHLQKNMAKENIALRKQIEGVREWAKHNWADGMGAALEQLSAALAEKEE